VSLTAAKFKALVYSVSGLLCLAYGPGKKERDSSGRNFIVGGRVTHCN
jgi:hypothetical protein